MSALVGGELSKHRVVAKDTGVLGDKELQELDHSAAGLVVELLLRLRKDGGEDGEELLSETKDGLVLVLVCVGC